MKQIRKLALGAISACVVAMAPVASHAATIQLGFILDRSGSIGSGNWTTIVNGLSTAIGLIPVGGADTYEVSVVSFGSTATINANSVVLNNAADRTALAATVAGIGFTGGSTNFAAAFSFMQTALTDVVGTAGFIQAGAGTTSYVNFATDGVPDNNVTGEAAANALTAAGVDNISIEGIGSGVNAANLQTNYCYPQPCTAAPTPFNFPTQGFYIGVADANAYAAAIGNKILIVTNQTPEPGTIALVGLALVGVGMARRKQA